jgi:uncharacterized protein (DUF849 family)
MSGRAVLIGAALNGERLHAGAPRTPSELAAAAAAAVAAGAAVLHVHPFDPDGRETLEPGPCGEAIVAVREACPGIPISLSTSAAIESDPHRRLSQIGRWDVQPALVTANQGESGIVDVCELLRSRGVGIEAGLLCHTDAEEFVRSTVPSYARRVLVEPLDADPRTACEHAGMMESILAAHAIELSQMHHGDGVASWAVNERALGRGHDVRTGIEDTGQLPDGTDATDNAELISTLAGMIEQMGGSVAHPHT